MRSFKWWILKLLLVLPLLATPSFAVDGPVIATDNVKARLVSENAAVGPGQSVWVALELTIRDGWHTYWRNPGDSGQATTLQWTLPAGFTAGEIVWQTPHRFDLPPLVNYGYAKHVMHLVQVTAPKDLKTGPAVALTAKASWLVCSDVCIPEDATVEVKLPTVAGVGMADPADATLFTVARSELPSAQPAVTTATVKDGQVIITLGKEWGETLSQIKSLAFFPYADGAIEYAAAQTLTHSKDSIELSMKAGDRAPSGGRVGGVLLATEVSSGETMTVPIEVDAALGGAVAHDAGAADAKEPLSLGSLGSLVLLAMLGGLILNLMPCVFPVLSIKAIGLVEQAKKDPAAVRIKGLVFAAGVVSSMLSLAAVLLVLRAGGEEIGWGFQLQSPLFVTLMVYLLLAVGLNLSGVFEVGGGFAGIGDGLTRGDSYRASFFTGLLTTLVATPCTAPFMAPAVGAALSQPPVVALTIFAALGTGLSLPYLVLSFAPWTRRALPKPGAWMDTLKQIFAFPMYGSAAWLLWVLAQQTSSIGLGCALAGAILVALAAWSYQKSKISSTAGRLVALVTAAAAVVLAVVLPVQFAGTAVAASSGGAAASNEPGAWQAYDAGRVSELNAAGKPMLVNFTASWCLTCLVNERNAFTDSKVQAVFRDKGVTLMKGDWTNRDPAITKALAEFKRAGVPLYVVYNSKPGSNEPVVLPQILTANVVHDAFVNLPDLSSK